METDDFSGMALESDYFLSCFDIPEFGVVVHGTCGDEISLRRELKAHNFELMTA